MLKNPVFLLFSCYFLVFLLLWVLLFPCYFWRFLYLLGVSTSIRGFAKQSRRAREHLLIKLAWEQSYKFGYLILGETASFLAVTIAFVPKRILLNCQSGSDLLVAYWLIVRRRHQYLYHGCGGYLQ